MLRDGSTAAKCPRLAADGRTSPPAGHHHHMPSTAGPAGACLLPQTHQLTPSTRGGRRGKPCSEQLGKHVFHGGQPARGLLTAARAAGSEPASPGPKPLTTTEANILALKTIMDWNLRTCRRLVTVSPVPLTPEVARRLCLGAAGGQAAAASPGGAGVLCPWLPSTTAVLKLLSEGFKVVGVECSAAAVERACHDLGLRPEETGVHDGWVRHAAAATAATVAAPKPGPPNADAHGAPSKPAAGPQDPHPQGRGDAAARQGRAAPAAADSTQRPAAVTQPHAQRREPNLYLYRGNPYNLTPPVLSLVPFDLHAVWDTWGLLVTPPELLPRYAAVWADLLPRGGVWLAAAFVLQPQDPQPRPAAASAPGCLPGSGVGGPGDGGGGGSLEANSRTEADVAAVDVQAATSSRGNGFHVHDLRGVLLPALERAGFSVEVLTEGQAPEDADLLLLDNRLANAMVPTQELRMIMLEIVRI
ncbi:hypothetical protein PLESTF_001971500 [Pleodorina starrii]|nr:hypothetical protein PLESTM_000986500 [Pleodorina starrii]GLC77676.1 hypothetical protein PLESTF_001971500 [Pleodorina starrii]